MPTAMLQEETVLGPESAGLRMTPEEFDAVEDYDRRFRYELIEGVVVVSPIPLPEERGPNDLLGYFLWNYRENHPQGAALNFTCQEEYVQIPAGRRIADRVVWAGLASLPDPTDVLPSIVVEFVSGSKRDRQCDYVDKRQEYVALRIPEYWIIDRFARTMSVICVSPKGKVSELVAGENETYESPLLPGFLVPIGRLLAAADSLAAARMGTAAKRKSVQARPKRNGKRGQE